MFQIHRRDFVDNFLVSTGASWKLFMFDGEVPSCFEDMPFDLSQDKLAIFNESKSWKFLNAIKENDTLRFNYAPATHINFGYGVQNSDFGYKYIPDRVVDGPHVQSSIRYTFSRNFFVSAAGLDKSYANYGTIGAAQRGNYIEYHYDDEVEIDAFYVYQGGSSTIYHPRHIKIEYKNTDNQWVECFNGNVYPGMATRSFMLSSKVTAKEFRFAFTSGDRSFDTRVAEFSLINTKVPRTMPDFTPTWGVLMPDEFLNSYAAERYRDTNSWPAILVNLVDPTSSEPGVKLNKATFKAGDLIETMSIIITNETWESKGPDTVDPVFVAPSTITLAATDASGAAKTDEGIQNFFKSIKVTDNYDCHIPVINDCPDQLPMGDTDITFTATDRAGNTGTHVTKVTIADRTGPVVSITGDITYTLEAGTPFVDEGATAVDNVDGDVTANIVVTGVDAVDENKLGVYTVDYTVADAAGNSTTETRTITVQDSQGPVISGVSNITFDAASSSGTPKSDSAVVAFLASVTATDNLDASSTVSNDCPNTLPIGVTRIVFTSTDNEGNTSVAHADVTVADRTAPVITLTGPSAVTLNVNAAYNEQGATAVDNVDGDVSGNIAISGAYNLAQVGDYVLSYDVSDAAGNAATTVQRTIQVRDLEAPVITLNGDASINLTVGDTYTEQGATAIDNVDGDISGNIVTSSNVDTSSQGTYQVTYNVSDAAGNAATEVTRTVNVGA